MHTEYSLLYATTEENPEVKLENKQLKEEIKSALQILNQEALIAQLYYVEELNIYEISVYLI